MVDENYPEDVRRRASRLDAAALAAQALLAGVGLGIAIAWTLKGPFSNGMTAAGFIVLAVVASFGAMSEWNRERRAEQASLLAGVFGVIMSLVAGVEGYWWYAPALAVVSFAVCFGTVNRFIVRDEARHRYHGH